MAVRRELAQEYIRLNQLWTHDWILNLLAALHGGLYYCRDPLLFYRLHGSNVIGMAQGEHAQRHIPLYPQALRAGAGVQVFFLEGVTRRPAWGAHQYSAGDLQIRLRKRPPAKSIERSQRDTWKALQTKRLRLIEQRKAAFLSRVLPDASRVLQRHRLLLHL